MSDARVKTGTYVGTGAAVNIALGFQPAAFIVWNETDGDALWLWADGMAAGTAIAIAAAVAAQGSNGVTKYDGAEGVTAKGITVGTALSESGKTHRYIAFRGD